MRQGNGGDPGGVVRLLVREPTQFGDGEGSDRDAADGVGPPARAEDDVAVAELLDELLRCLRRAGVVPQQRGSDDLTGGVEGDHPVLLSAD